MTEEINIPLTDPDYERLDQCLQTTPNLRNCLFLFTLHNKVSATYPVDKIHYPDFQDNLGRQKFFNDFNQWRQIYKINFLTYDEYEQLKSK